ncbi:MAG TPA: hypothetical protein DDZ88_03780 [Verrucomicrobiales bacterium]|nr:hypothetical protein [Verrucomicrobiales bacterium]
MKTILFLALLAFQVLPSPLRAHATTISVKVLEVSKKGEEHVLLLEPQNHKTFPKQITIHLKFDLKKAAFAASHSRDDFDGALKALEAAVTTKNPITIGLMSGTGFNPIKGRPGHFRSEAIQFVDWFGKPEVVCFFHSDHYVVAPE